MLGELSNEPEMCEHGIFGCVYCEDHTCKTCKYWDQFELETIGICNKAFEAVLFTVSSGQLETREEFGCVAWEAK